MSVPRRTRPAPAKGERILQRLRRYAVPFVLIGELAEVAHGSTVKPGGVIEICVASTDVARERLSLALGDRGPKNLRILTETPAGDDYDVLVRNTIAMHVEPGILVRVAALEDLIRSRRARRTPKDSEAARVLSAILEESPPG